MFKAHICGGIAGIVYSTFMQLSCDRVHELPWAVHGFLQDEYVVYTTVDSIPKPIIDTFSSYPDVGIPMADPGEDYNETDVEDKPGLPFSRLIFAGHSDQNWFVFSEEGGIARHNKLVLYKYTNGQVKFRCMLVFYHKPDDLDLAGLRRMITSGKRIYIG